jgi:hypothetical protein
MIFSNFFSFSQKEHTRSTSSYVDFVLNINSILLGKLDLKLILSFHRIDKLGIFSQARAN